jgi:hypothetical protein
MIEFLHEMCDEEAGGSVHSAEGIAKLLNVGRCQVDTLTSSAHGILLALLVSITL